MEPLHIDATKSTPAVCFREDTHILEITGESYPENAAAFYGPIFDWLLRFLQNGLPRSLIVDIMLVYFNSSTSKILMNLFDSFEDAAENGWQILVNWRYHEDNETALECGEEFREDYDSFGFNLVRMKDEND
jgi:hypothetical protein